MAALVQNFKKGPGNSARAFFMLALVAHVPVQAQTHHDLRLKREVAITGAGVATLAAGRYLVLEKPVEPLFIYDRSGVPAIDRVALDRWSKPSHTASDIGLFLTYGASVAVGVINQKGQDRHVPVAIIMESGLLSAGITVLVKHAVARPRPYLYGEAVPLEDRPLTDGLVSFWSGHTSTAAAASFACANMVQRSDSSKGLKTATWIGAAVMPAAVGYLRVSAGRHFPTDVLTGYAFGAVAGWAVPYFHRVGKKPRPLVE